MKKDNDHIDLDGIDSDRITDEMAETIEEALSLLDEYVADRGSIPNSLNGGPESREDCWFDTWDEEVLFDAWEMLRYSGLSVDELDPLTRAIEADTIYDRGSLITYYDRIVNA